jgi:hypothetical protein
MYTCPMHPEVRQEGPGRCPKCHMALVPEAEVHAKPKQHSEDRGLGPITWKSYIPLMVIFGLLIAVTLAASWGDYANREFALPNTIGYFMAGFFLVFAGFKLLDLKGFAEGYSTYDLLASRWSSYGYIYHTYTGVAPLVADHVDGDWKNNREKNLRLLCPNCDSLTPTYAGANKGKGRPNRPISKRVLQARQIVSLTKS